MSSLNGPLRVGIGGPVGSGKTALVDALCKAMRARFELVAITNDIYTREDAEFLTRSGALPPERIRGVETGGGPPTPAAPGRPLQPPADSARSPPASSTSQRSYITRPTHPAST